MSTFVGEGRGDVTAAEIERWVRFVYQADAEHRDAPNGGVPPAVIAAEAASEHRHRVTVRRHLDDDDRVETTTGIGPRGARLTFVPAADTNEVLDTGEGIETDGGPLTGGNSIDPFVCPRGHHAVSLGASRFGCETCRANGLDPCRWDRSELVDLRREDPPLDERKLRADGGHDRKRRRDSIVEAVLAGRRPSERLQTNPEEATNE
jgi:hypothetical protein